MKSPEKSGGIFPPELKNYPHLLKTLIEAFTPDKKLRRKKQIKP